MNTTGISTIAKTGLSQGFFVGAVSDYFGEKIPVIRDFLDENGNDILV
jgi:hypothetical protein